MDILERIEKKKQEFKDVDEDGWYYYQTLADDTERNVNYEVLKSAIADIDSISKEELTTLVSHYGFKVNTGKGIDDFYQPDIPVPIYKTMDEIVEGKCDFDPLCDSDIALAAINGSSATLEYFSDKLRADKEFCLSAVHVHPEAYEHISDEMKQDREILNETVKGFTEHGCMVMSEFPPEVLADKKFMLEAVRQDRSAYRYGSKEICELCNGRDPVKALEATIAFEELQKSLVERSQQTISRKMKI